jgi:hypothetical protein
MGPAGIENFFHVDEHRACQPPLAEIPDNPSDESCQLQGRAMSGSKPKLFVPQLAALDKFMWDSGKQDLFEEFASRIQQTNGPIR